MWRHRVSRGRVCLRGPPCLSAQSSEGVQQATQVIIDISALPDSTLRSFQGHLSELVDNILNGSGPGDRHNTYRLGLQVLDDSQNPRIHEIVASVGELHIRKV